MQTNNENNSETNNRNNNEIENCEILGGCDCLLNDGIPNQDDVQVLGGKRRKQSQRKSSNQISPSEMNNQFESLHQQKESQQRSEFQNFNNDSDKQQQSFNNYRQMIQLYTDAIKNGLQLHGENSGDPEVLADANYLTMDRNENKLRSVFIKWPQQSSKILSQLKTSQMKSQISRISNHLSQLSQQILNKPITDYNMYMDDVMITINDYRKHLKQLDVKVQTKQVKDQTKYAIDTLLKGGDEKKTDLLKEFIKYDDQLFERMELNMKTQYTQNSDDYKGFQRFMKLRTETFNKLITNLTKLENITKQDLNKYKNHVPSEKEYNQLMGMYTELKNYLLNNEDKNGPHSVMEMKKVYTQEAFDNYMDILSSKFNEVQYLAGQNEVGNEGLRITELNVDEIYKRAFQSIVVLINNYEFLLRYCNAIKQVNQQFQQFDIKQCIIDVIANYYLILFFIPGKDKIYIRPFSVDNNNFNEFIPDRDNNQIQRRFQEENNFNNGGAEQININKSEFENIQNIGNIRQQQQQQQQEGPIIIRPGQLNTRTITAWKNLNLTNAEYGMYNSLSNIILSAIKTIYGTFNLIIEYYLKPEKTISQIITGGAKKQQTENDKLVGNVAPIKDAFVFYKLIKEAFLIFKQQLQDVQRAQKVQDGNYQEKDIIQQLQLYTSSKFYDLWMYFNKEDQQNIDDYLRICNKLWNSYHTSTEGVLSQRLRDIINDFLKELVKNLVSRLYLGQQDNGNDTALDQMSVSYRDIHRQTNSLYLTDNYTHNNLRMNMPIPQVEPLKQKDNIIDTYLQVVKIINNLVENKIPTQLDDWLKLEKEYKNSLIQFFQEKVDRYNKIQRPEQKYYYFIEYMNSSILDGADSMFIGNQVKFIKNFGIALNQYTVYIGEVIKMLVIYHKKYVELSGPNYQKAIAKIIVFNNVLHNNVQQMSLRQWVFNTVFNDQGILFNQRFNQYLNEYKGQITPQNIQTVQQNFTKLEQDLYSTDTLYTYLLVCILQSLETNAQADILQSLIEFNVIRQFRPQEKGVEGNIPFIINNTKYILSNETYNYLQTHQPYMKFAYYNSFKEYLEMTEFLSKINGLEIVGGQLNYQKFLHQLEQKRQYVISVFKEFKQLSYDDELYNYMLKHLDNGLNYHNFFLDAFEKFCPGPLPLQYFTTFNNKTFKFDLDKWYYNFNKLYTNQNSHIEMSFEVKPTTMMEAPKQLKTNVQILSPFDLNNENYKFNDGIQVYYKNNQQGGALQTDSNLQLEVNDYVNYLISISVSIFKKNLLQTPKEFIEELQKNPVIQQGMQLTQIDYNGNKFMIPINTLQTPFKCPAIFIQQSQNELVKQLNGMVQADEIKEQLQQYGCFFINAWIQRLLVALAGGVNYSMVPQVIKSQLKDILDQVARGQLNVNNIKNRILAIRNDTAVNEVLASPSYNQTIYLLTNPQKLADVLRFGADILYTWDNEQRITQYQQYNVQFVNIPDQRTLDRYNEIKDTQNEDPRLITIGEQTLYDIIGSLTTNEDVYNSMRQANPVPGPHCILPLVTLTQNGQVQNGRPLQIGEGQNRGVILMPGEANIIQSSKFQALSEELKRQYGQQLREQSVSVIYNKSTQQIELYKQQFNADKLYQDKDNSILYLSTVMLLQNPEDIQLTDSQKYNMLYDLLIHNKRIQDYMNKIQGIQIPQIQQDIQILQSLKNGVSKMINICKQILSKPGVGLDFKKENFGQTIFDPMLFVMYTNENINSEQYQRIKTLYMQYLNNENPNLIPDVKSETIKNWFEINRLKTNIQNINFNIKFRPQFNIFQRAAFIKRRIQQKQIIGADHYWILDEYPLMLRKDQPIYTEQGQYENLGWYHKIQKQMQSLDNNYDYEGIYNPENFDTIYNDQQFQLINIQDNSQWNTLYQFTYAFIVYSPQAQQVQQPEVQNNNYEEVEEVEEQNENDNNHQPRPPPNEQVRVVKQNINNKVQQENQQLQQAQQEINGMRQEIQQIQQALQQNQNNEQVQQLQQQLQDLNNQLQQGNVNINQLKQQLQQAQAQQQQRDQNRQDAIGNNLDRAANQQALNDQALQQLLNNQQGLQQEQQALQQQLNNRQRQQLQQQANDAILIRQDNPEQQEDALQKQLNAVAVGGNRRLNFNNYRISGGAINEEQLIRDMTKYSEQIVTQKIAIGKIINILNATTESNRHFYKQLQQRRNENTGKYEGIMQWDTFENNYVQQLAEQLREETLANVQAKYPHLDNYEQIEQRLEKQNEKISQIDQVSTSAYNYLQEFSQKLYDTIANLNNTFKHLAEGQIYNAVEKASKQAKEQFEKQLEQQITNLKEKAETMVKISDTVKALQQQIEQHTQQFNALNQNIKQIQDTQTLHTTQINDLTSNVNNLKEFVNSIEPSIKQAQTNALAALNIAKELQNRGNIKQEDLNKINQDAQNIMNQTLQTIREQDITALRKDLDSIKNQPQVQQLIEQLKGVQDEINIVKQVQENFNDLQNKINKIDTIDPLIKGLQQQINNCCQSNASIENKIQQMDIIKDMTQNIQNNAQKIEQLTKQVKDLTSWRGQTDQKMSLLEKGYNTINSLQDRISSIEQQMSVKVQTMDQQTQANAPIEKEVVIKEVVVQQQSLMDPDQIVKLIDDKHLLDILAGYSKIPDDNQLNQKVDIWASKIKGLPQALQKGIGDYNGKAVRRRWKLAIAASIQYKINQTKAGLQEPIELGPQGQKFVIDYIEQHTQPQNISVFSGKPIDNRFNKDSKEYIGTIYNQKRGKYGGDRYSDIRRYQREGQFVNIYSPLSIMQEITFYAGTTNYNTLNIGRDIYGLEYSIDFIQQQRLDPQTISQLSFYRNTYKLLMNNLTNIPGITYNKDDRIAYLIPIMRNNVPVNNHINRTALLLQVSPIQFVYQILTHDFKLTEKAQQQNQEEKLKNFIFKVLNIEPFNPIQLIKQNLPYPIMQAMSIYIDTYNKRYLKVIDVNFINDGSQLLKLNQTYNNQAVYVIVDNNNHPIGRDRVTENQIIIDTSNGRDMYYTGTAGKTLYEVKQNPVGVEREFIPLLNQNNVVMTERGYILSDLRGKPLITVFRKTQNNLGEQSILQQIFTTIPKYFYQNSQLLQSPTYNRITKYTQQPNGQLTQQNYNSLTNQPSKFYW